MKCQQLTEYGGRRLYFFADREITIPSEWPQSDGQFALMISIGSNEPPNPESVMTFAREALSAGATSVTTWGRWADEIEDYFLDALTEGCSMVEGGPGLSALRHSPLDEALWNAWHLFPAGEPPIVVCLFDDHLNVPRLKRLANNLSVYFARIEARA